MSVYEKFREVDSRAGLSSVKYKGIKVWAYLRVYFGAKFTLQYDKTQKVKGHLDKRFFRHFFHGFWNWFRRYDAIAFTVSHQRKPYNGLLYDRADWVKGMEVLVLDLPRPDIPKRKEVASRYNATRTPLLVLEMLLTPFLKPKRPFEGEEEIEKVKEELEVPLDHRFYIGRLRAQRIIMKLLLWWKKPKVFFLVNSYVNMGYVMACKEKGVPVVEFQHGSISKNHFGYWVENDLGDRFFPDHLFSFGEREVSYFNNEENGFRVREVIPIGAFHLERVKEEEVYIQEIEEARKAYEAIIGITGQDAFEGWMLPYLEKMGQDHPELFFVYIPRHSSVEEVKEQFSFTDNIWITKSYDTFELLSVSDFHMTINSTCALEARTVGTPNILLDHEGRARAYFEKDMPEGPFTHYMDPEDDIGEVVRERKELVNRSKDRAEEISQANRFILKPGFWENLDQAVKKVLEESE